jgi:hypothetical protein
MLEYLNSPHVNNELTINTIFEKLIPLILDADEHTDSLEMLVPFCWKENSLLCNVYIIAVETGYTRQQIRETFIFKKFHTEFVNCSHYSTKNRKYVYNFLLVNHVLLSRENIQESLENIHKLE